MTNTSLYNATPQTGTVSTTNLTSLYSNTTNFTSGIVTSAVNSVNAGVGIAVNPTTGNVVVTNTGVTSIVAGTNISISGATGAVTVNATDTNTTYNIDATTATGGANLNLNGSDSTTDSVKFASGTGITVSRTDANTITITNSNPGGTGVTSITGTANQINASSSTGAVTLSTPQDIATTSTPTFAGATLGNVTVGVVDDQTIATTSGLLKLNNNGSGTDYVLIESSAANPVTIQRFTTGTNVILRSLALGVQSTGTPVAGFGNSLEFQIEAQPSNTVRAGSVNVVSDDLTAGAENFYMTFGLMQNGAAIATKAQLDYLGNFSAMGRLSGTAVDIDGRVSLDTTSFTTSTTTPNQVISSVTTLGGYRSVKYQVQITSGTDYQALEILLIHDGTTAYINTYGDVRTGANLSTFDASLSGAAIQLLATPTNAVTTYKTFISAMTT